MGITSMPVGQAPETLLQQALQGQVPEIEPYKALAELNKRVKGKQLSIAEQGNAAIQQAMQLRQKPTVAQEVQQANNAINQGIGQLPAPTQQFASGGIVSFAEGGKTPYTWYRDEKGEYLLSQDGRTKYYRGKNSPENTDVISPYASDSERAAAIAKNKNAEPFPTFVGEIPRGNWYTANDGVRYEYPEAGAGRGHFLPPAGITYPKPSEPEPIVPKPLKEQAKDTVKTATRTGGGGAARSTLKAPEFNLKAPEYDKPEAKSAEEFANEARKMVSPQMAEYDARMRKYLERAQAMQRGEGIDKPSRLKRGVDAGLAGATEEVMAARRAGVRPSLGMALAGAGRSASASDKEYKDKLEAMREKGFEREFALEQARIAQENGQTDRAAKWMGVAESRAAEIRQISNAGKDKQFEVDKGGYAAKQRNYELDREAEEKAKDRATTLAAASIRSESRGAITPERVASVRRAAAADVDKMLQKDPKFLMQQAREPAAAAQRKEMEINRRMQEIFQKEDGIVLPTPGATPGAAPSRVIDFSTIK